MFRLLKIVSYLVQFIGIVIVLKASNVHDLKIILYMGAGVMIFSIPAALIAYIEGLKEGKRRII